MAKMEDAVINVVVKMSLWQALKIRISGRFNNAISFEQEGAIIQIKYQEKEI